MAHKQWISPCVDGQPLDRDWTEYVREIRDGYDALSNNHSPEGVSNFIKKYAAPGSHYERLQGGEDANSHAVLSAWINCLSYLQKRAMNGAETEEARSEVVRASNDIVALLRGELQTGDVIPPPLMFRASEAGERLEREIAELASQKRSMTTKKRKRSTESSMTKSSGARRGRINGGGTKGRSRSRRRSRTVRAGRSKAKNSVGKKTSTRSRARPKRTRFGV